MCACTEPVGTGIGAVRVERDRQKWPITMLNNTHTLTRYRLIKNKSPYTLARPVRKTFFPWKAKEKRLALRASRASLLLLNTRYSMSAYHVQHIITAGEDLNNLDRALSNVCTFYTPFTHHLHTNTHQHTNTSTSTGPLERKSPARNSA